MRGDARKRIADMAGTEDVERLSDIAMQNADRLIEADERIADLQMLARQLLEDADTTHPDPFLRGCATGTTDTARAILERLGDNA